MFGIGRLTAKFQPQALLDGEGLTIVLEPINWQQCVDTEHPVCDLRDAEVDAHACQRCNQRTLKCQLRLQPIDHRLQGDH